jgi:hypothetical protein
MVVPAKHQFLDRGFVRAAGALVRAQTAQSTSIQEQQALGCWRAELAGTPQRPLALRAVPHQPQAAAVLAVPAQEAQPRNLAALAATAPHG